MKQIVMLQVLQIYTIVDASLHEGITIVHTIFRVQFALLSPKYETYEIHINKDSSVYKKKCYRFNFLKFSERG